MRSRTQIVALLLVVVAVVPYITLKLLWLGGATIGLTSSAALTELHSGRMMAGNGITIVLELLAVGLALVLTRPWGRRVPAWLVVGLGAGATGLLAPILLGLPLGGVLQLVVRGNVHTGGMDNMSPWVFALAYGGFGLLAIAIALLAWGYALARWGYILDGPPPRPAGWSILVGAFGLLPFAAAMLWWGLLGPGTTGPQGMDALAQRTALVVTGLLAAAGFAAPLLARASARQPHAAWLIAWAGCTTAALQGPTEVLLANGGHPPPAIILIALVTTPASCAYGLLVLRRRTTDLKRTDAQPADQLTPAQKTQKLAPACQDRMRKALDADDRQLADDISHADPLKVHG